MALVSKKAVETKESLTALLSKEEFFIVKNEWKAFYINAMQIGVQFTEEQMDEFKMQLIKKQLKQRL